MITSVIFARICTKQRLVGRDISASPEYFIRNGLTHILPLTHIAPPPVFGYCSSPYCDFDKIVINCAALISTLGNCCEAAALVRS